MDPKSDAQLLVSADGNVVVAANADIYNFKELYSGLAKTGVDYEPKTGNEYQSDVLCHAFEKAVVRRMMSDVPWGVWLSGGRLDSSLVASVASRHMAQSSKYFPRLHSFSVGLEGSPDLKATRVVADYLGTKPHSYTYTLEEGADAVRAVVTTLETYDVTTIHASMPMYLMARKIKAMGIKMVLSGEGASEVFGGYLYFHTCPVG
ncbi:hypothetical protein ACHAWF_000730, partial [Thalassiosira exigua]